MKANILVVDDNNIFREGLILILEKHNGYNVIGSVVNQQELFSMLDNLKPDLIIVNVSLPREDILIISKKLTKKYPRIPYIIIAQNKDELLILDCVIHGARGIIWKENTSIQLYEAINTVLSGGNYLFVPESMINNNHLKLFKDRHIEINGFDALSEREQEVFRLFVDGKSYKDIGAKLNISPRTVETHKKNILFKLKLESTIDMVKYGLKYNLTN